MSMERKVLRATRLFALLLACLLAHIGDAIAQTQPACGNTVIGNHTVSISPSATIASYNAYGGMGVQSFAITLTRGSLGALGCRLGIYIEGGRTTKTLVNGANILNYDILRSGTSILFPSGVTPAGGNVAVFETAPGGSYSFNVSFEVTAGQVVPEGVYADLLNEIVVRGINPAGNFNNSTRRHAMPTQATVIKGCKLGTPSATTLAFAAGDIPNGLPNEGVVKSTSMSGSCTAPSFLRLTGQALQPASPTPPRAGFDNYINYTANGAFSSGSVTLNSTTTGQTVSSASAIGAANSVVTGTVAVNVNMKRANPIIAGTYSGTLTVTLEPAP